MTGPSARVRSPQPESSAEGASSLTIRIGPQELVIRRRYEAELSFYRQVWRIGAASEAEGQDEETFTVKVENLH